MNNDKGKGTKRKQAQKKNDQQAKKLKLGYSLLLLRIIHEFVDVVDCANEILKFVGEHYLPMVDGGSEKYGKLPSAVLRGYSLHGFHFSSASCENGPGMFIPNVTVICTKNRYGGGIYYLIKKVTPTQVRGILLRTVCISTQWDNPITRRRTITYLSTHYGDGHVKKIPAQRWYKYAGEIDTPAEERMTTKETTCRD